MNLRKESLNCGMYITTTSNAAEGFCPRLSDSSCSCAEVESRIDSMYIDSVAAKEHPYRIESYLSEGPATENTDKHLKCYFAYRCKFAAETPTGDDIFDIKKVGDGTFLNNISPKSLQQYQLLMKDALNQSGPVIEIAPSTSADSQKLVIAYRRGTTEHFLTAVTDLYQSNGFYSIQKFVENFSNGITIIIVYLKHVHTSDVDVPMAILNVAKELSMLYTIPNSPLYELFFKRLLTAQEVVYGTSILVFAQHFMNRLGKEYWSLRDALKGKGPRSQQVLNSLKRRLRGETFTTQYILDIMKRFPDLIKILYANFAVGHQEESKKNPRMSVFSINLHKIKSLTLSEIEIRIAETTQNEHEKMVFDVFLQFNKHVIKTNFYSPSKIALAFKLEPSFLPIEEYSTVPFGVYMVLGNEFRGFHVRFQDIARGGIRVIKSRNHDVYNSNKKTLFDENYSLAFTQNRKNKDIPEGGAKGTILLDCDRQDSAKVAFEKYIDALIDLMIECKPGDTNDILFFGPDEGTAEFMDWASEHAKLRGLPHWKALTTGKSQTRGGIPHDTYGMTTRSVHQYVLGIYRQLGLDEECITKFQTGGPDGDLGSNEIKISKDKSIAIVDGSGVLYDPEGIDRGELLRLAGLRKMIADFDTKKLGNMGFRVLVEETNVPLPDGTTVQSGLDFRNHFHLNELSTADLFVPCGGRPESVDVSNYQKLISEDGTPRFKYIVEGANLFFSQEARILLENAGCVIFKDASANKGGVTSSSLEVLAALAMTDEEFLNNMTVSDGKVSEFYAKYVVAVQKIIEENARVEFECLWREKELHPEKTRSEISDELSAAIIKLKTQLQLDNNLWKNEKIRKYALSKMIPGILQKKVGGLDVIIKRLPENYLRSMFSSHISSHFVYKYGPNAKQLSFFSYIGSLAKTAS